MDTSIVFKYLSEPDTITAGVNDAAKTIAICEEVFSLLAKGDYLMGGSNGNSHGLGLVFPDASPFPNMPVSGPDRRFVAMPAYLGGRYDICGCKWYGSNAANKEKQLPRSILTLTLNDKDTGKPLGFMSANLLSAARTGAIPAAAARHLARRDSKVIAVLGCGPINQSCLRHLMTELDGIKKVICYDLFEDIAKRVADQTAETYGVEGIVGKELVEILQEADVVTIAASRIKPLELNYEWVKKGATLLFTGPAKGDNELWTKSKIVYDHIGLHESYMAEAIESGDKEKYYNGVIGGPIYRLIDSGELPELKNSTSLGMIINGEKVGRTSDDDVFIFVACGMAVFDLAVGYNILEEAKKKGLGQDLVLWEEPAL